MLSTSEKEYIIQASNIQKLEEIAKGGFGVVYKGLMQGNIEVAIKELYNQSISQKAQEDMEQEILMSLKMHHPNMVSLYGYCSAPLCLVMEFLPQNLFDLLQNEQDLQWDLRYKISLDIVLGLEFIHEKNIVHRDLKSSNILLDDKLKAKITDFGLYQVRAESKFLATKQEVGYTHWMAPELININPKYSKQSDIFAMGVIFWEIATRGMSLNGAQDQFIRESVRAEEREEIPEDCPQEYRQIIQGC